MQDIFKNVIVTSVSGGLLFIVLFVLKPVTRRIFSPTWQYYIWLIVLLVLTVPISFEMPAQSIERVYEEIPISENVRQPAAEIGNKIKEQYNNVFHTEKRDVYVFNILPLLWFIGVVSVLTYKILRYIAFMNGIRKNSYEWDIYGLSGRLRIRKTNVLDAPLMIGIIRPTIYMPNTDISEESLSYILKHELVHYRRKDIIYKWLAMVIGCIHWFNPFVYLLIKNIDEDCEVSCDYIVTQNMAYEERISYMNTILDMAVYSIRKPKPLSTQMAGNKKIFIRRFTAIRKGKKPLLLSAMGIIAALMIFTAAVFGGSYLNRNISDIDISRSMMSEKQMDKIDSIFSSTDENILIIGTFNNRKADMAALFSYSDGINMLSIPVYMLLDGDVNINSFFNDRERVITAFENTLDVHIDKYIVFDVNALKDIADRTNGVNLDIGHKLIFADPELKKEKVFPRGNNTLSGDDLMEVLYYRDPVYGNAETYIGFFSSSLPMIFEKENLSILDANIISTDIEGNLADYSDILRESCFKRVCLMLMPVVSKKNEIKPYTPQLDKLYTVKPDNEKLKKLLMK